MKLFSLLTLLLFTVVSELYAQSDSDWLFDDTSLPEIYITVDSTDLELILTNVFSDTEYPAEFVFMRDNIADTVKNIGFRIRGNTSRVSKKKSFKVSFDTFEDGREFRGLDKMNINGEHNDPSIIRSKLSWDVFEALEVPAPRSNHVRLYINEEYFGLYINVEHIDNEFVEDRFGSSAGNLYKSLYPSDLTYLGDDTDDYKRVENGRRIYELKTNEDEDDYTDIANFIKFLENSNDQEFEQQIRDYINVDGVIRVMSVDILTGMWDNYMFNKNNYYLYQNPSTNRFEFIPFDYDNTFGIDWFGIDWDQRDINNWGTSQSRPLTDRLFAIPKYRDRLNYYIDELVESHFNRDMMFPEIDRLKSMIQSAAEEDIYRTLDYDYTISDFNNSYENALGDHVKNGVKGYISTRAITAVIQTSGNNIVPVIKSADANLSYGTGGAILNIEVSAFDDDTLDVTAIINGGQRVALTTNGSNGIYNAEVVLGDISGSISISIEAMDSSLQTERYPFNPNNYITVEGRSTSNNIVINEFMASNNSTIQDPFGAYEDWVELYNPTSESISLLGYYLTDDLSNPTKWAFPDTSIAPQNFLLIWTDDDEDEGPLHTTFRLSTNGEDLGLYYSEDGSIQTVDAFSFNEQTTDVSYGRQTDGNTAFVFFASPTPGATNGTDTSNDIEEIDLPSNIKLHQNYPNPFNPSTNITFSLLQATSLKLTVYSVHGALLQTIADGRFNAGIHTINFEAGSLASGIYFYRLETITGEILTQKMTLLK